MKAFLLLLISVILSAALFPQAAVPLRDADTPALTELSPETVARQCFAALVAGDAEAVRDCLAPQTLDDDPSGSGVRRAVRYFSELYENLGRPDWTLDAVKIRKERASVSFSLAGESATLDLVRTDAGWKVLL